MESPGHLEQSGASDCGCISPRKKDDTGSGCPNPGPEGVRMHSPHARTLALTPPRRVIGDLVHFARRVPTVPVQRRMRLAAVAAARSAARPRPGWCAVFTKAYAIVAAARPELRRTYLAFPRPHLYE